MMPTPLQVGSGPAPTAAHYRRNRLLAALPDQQLELLAAHLQLVDLQLGDRLHATGQPIEHVYFPLDSVISVVTTPDPDTHVEVTTIGVEGMAGLSAFLGTSTSPAHTYCQIAGRAARLGTATLHRLVTDSTDLHHLLHRYTAAFLTFITQNITCERTHDSASRCARWIAETGDRIGEDTFLLTQEFLAQMVGVRRATISTNAAALQQAGLIRYTRGRITITDRAGLETAACDCYPVVAAALADVA